MTSLGSAVRYDREKLGMTQKATGEALGVSSVHPSYIESGVTPPSALLIARFAEFYGIDLYVLNYCIGVEDNLPEAVKQARRKLAEALSRQLGDPGDSG